MNSLEIRATLSLALIYVLRILGLFMIIPVFVLYAEGLPGATPLLIGLGLGIYGLTQAALQIPMGLLSDRIGRKPVIAFGLLLMILGSAVCAWAPDMGWMIIGRTLQGGGAVAAAVSALVADLTRETQRTKAMLIVGASIGMSFILSLMLGPILAAWIGVAGIFALTAILGVMVLPMLFWVVPAAPAPVGRPGQAWSDIRSVLSDARLMQCNLGIFVLHLTFTASFVALPLALRHDVGWHTGEHWKLYLGAVLSSLPLTLLMIWLAEKRGHAKTVYIAAVGLLALIQMGFWAGHTSLAALACIMLLFFAVFDALESMLPSWVSKLADPATKGTAMGVFSSCQFGGSFVGGVLGGWVMGSYGLPAVFLSSVAILLLWFALCWRIRPPVHKSSVSEAAVSV